MPTKKTTTIDWKPFSQKHKDYIKSALNNKMNVAEGAIRSGKTIDHCIIAAMYLEECPDKIHLASGSTLGNAKLNIGVCNGFGLENLFRGRCKWGKYKDNEALFIKTQTGDKVVIFVGGSKADAYKRILGNSYGLWIATEINEHYDCDDSRSSFIKVAFGRQVAATWPLVLWDLNPCNPSNRIYKEYIDLYKEQYVGGYQYRHFTIHDNLSISEERKREIESQYVKGSIWYRRDILGERCIAEGLVYPMWEEALADPPADEIPSDYCVSMDYGTMNAFAALLWAKYGNVWYAVREYYYSGRTEQRQKTDEDYGKDIDTWLADIVPQGGGKLSTIIDPSAASFIALLRKRGDRYKVLPADNAVADGIRETANAMENGFIKISPRLKAWKSEAEAYIWDDKCVDDRPVKENDHCLTGDTLVMAEAGAKPISELVGTEGKVWSYNTDSHIPELKPYFDCRLTQHNAEIYEIETKDGRIIRCTGEHPILTKRGYIMAKDLELSDEIVDIIISYITIKAIKKIGTADVYNMEVKDNHNFAINGGLIVHNCMDAMRYFVKTKRVIPKVLKKDKTINSSIYMKWEGK